MIPVVPDEFAGEAFTVIVRHDNLIIKLALGRVESVSIVTPPWHYQFEVRFPVATFVGSVGPAKRVCIHGVGVIIITSLPHKRSELAGVLVLGHKTLPVGGIIKIVSISGRFVYAAQFHRVDAVDQIHLHLIQDRRPDFPVAKGYGLGHVDAYSNLTGIAFEADGARRCHYLRAAPEREDSGSAHQEAGLLVIGWRNEISRTLYRFQSIQGGAGKVVLVRHEGAGIVGYCQHGHFTVLYRSGGENLFVNVFRSDYDTENVVGALAGCRFEMESRCSIAVRRIPGIEEEINSLKQVLVVTVYTIAGSVVTRLRVHRLTATDGQLDVRAGGLIQLAGGAGHQYGKQDQQTV